MSARNFSIILMLTAIFLCSCAGKFEAPPLYYEKDNLKEETTSQNYLGPFITYSDNEKFHDFGIRPFFFLHEEKKENVDEKEFLYPLLIYKGEENYTRTKALLSIISYGTETKDSGFVEKDLRLYPFIFYRDSEQDQFDHFGFFPFYGNLKNFLGKEEIDFIMFPFYLSSSNEGKETDSYLWPFISRYSGEHSGGRFLPFYGLRTAEKNELREKIVMLPFYLSKSKVFHGEKQYVKSYFPFYSESRILGIKNRSYLGPLISFTENEKKGTKRTDIPWPFVTFSEGDVERTRVFPFYSKTINENSNDEKGFVLWPVYSYKDTTLYDHSVHRKSVFLIFYKNIEKVSLDDGESIAKRVHFWPFFSYERDEEGYTNFHTLSLFEPFVRSNDRLYRNYSSFWRLYEKQTSPDGDEFTSVLWNIYSSKKTEDTHTVELKPLLPVFTYKKLGETKKFNLLGGFFGFENRKDGKYLNLLYFSIPVGDDKSEEDQIATDSKTGDEDI